MASSVNSRASSLEIPLAWSHVSSSQPVPPASPSGSQPQLPSTPPQQRFPQPGARRLSAGQPLNIKPQQAGLQSFTDSLQTLKKKLETEKKEQADFMAYARETGSEFWELPAPSHLPSDMEIAAFDATLKALSVRLNDDQTIDVRHSPSSSSDTFPYSSSFPVPFTLTSSGQGMGTARFSISGELGLLVFQSVATKSIAFDKEAISAYQPPSGHVNNPGESPVHANPTDPAPMEEATRRRIIAQGKRKAFASSAEALRESRSRENTGSPASYILQDAEFAARLQAEELAKASASIEESHGPEFRPVSAELGTASATVLEPESVPSASQAAGTSAGTTTFVPDSYTDIKSHSFVKDAWKALPNNGKSAYNLYAVLIGGKEAVKDGEALADAMTNYFDAFGKKNDAEKTIAITRIVHEHPNLSGLFSNIKNTIDSQMSSSSVMNAFANFAAFVNQAPESTANKTVRRTFDEGARFAFRSIAKLAFPEPPFQASVRAAFKEKADKRKLNDAHLIDEAMAKAGISPKVLTEATDHAALLIRVQNVKNSLTLPSCKALLLEWRKIRYPHELDAIAEAAVNEIAPKNRRYFDNCALALPYIAAINNQSSIEVLNSLEDKEKMFAGLAYFHGSSRNQIQQYYTTIIDQVRKTAAITNYLTYLKGKSTETGISSPSEHSLQVADAEQTDNMHAEPTSMKRRELSGTSPKLSSASTLPEDRETMAPSDTHRASLRKPRLKKRQRTLT